MLEIVQAFLTSAKCPLPLLVGENIYYQLADQYGGSDDPFMISAFSVWLTQIPLISKTQVIMLSSEGLLVLIVQERKYKTLFHISNIYLI